MTTVKEQIKDFFDKHDTDKNGCLDKSEIPAMLKELGLDAVKPEQFINASDKDGDRKISFEEFCNVMSI